MDDESKCAVVLLACVWAVDERFACTDAGLTLSSTDGVSSVASGMLLKASGATIYSKGAPLKGGFEPRCNSEVLYIKTSKAAEKSCANMYT